MPKSLFWRSFILIVSLIAASQVFTALLVRYLVVKPRVSQMAQFTATNLAAIQAALEVMSPEQRARFMADLNRGGRVRVEPAGAGQEVATRPANRLQRLYLARLAELLPQHAARIEWQRGPEHALRIRLKLAEGDVWVIAPTRNDEAAITRIWLWSSIGAGLFAAAGAFFIQRRLNAPLARLVAATETVGAGQPAAPVPEEGPSEIAALARGFNHMNARLADAERERAIMLAGVSHDLRSPLAKLRLALEIGGEALEAELREGMARNIDTMDAVIGQFLDFARAEHAEAAQLTDLDAMLRECAGGAFALDLALPKLVPLRAQAMQRGIANLIENAQRYGAAPFAIRGGSLGANLWFEVENGGAQLDAAQVATLTRPFVRGEAARSGAPGAGLGLAIVERIARLHGGTLALRAREGGGLVARVTIPCAELPGAT